MIAFSTATIETSTVETVSMVPAIDFEAVSKLFGTVHALSDISFSIPQGQVVTLLGPNGAGKSTAISLMLGLRRPSRGTVRLLGLDPRDHRARSCRGVMLQESGVPTSLTVRETIELFRSYYGEPMPVAHVLEIVGLTRQAATMVGTLSGGQRQRLYFAVAICGNPRLLFLDEPTAALDVEARHSFWDQIRHFAQQGTTVLLTTHDLEEAGALSERVIVIDKGRVRADASPAVLKAQVADKRISFDVNEPLSLEFFARLPVQQLELRGQHVTLLTPKLETVLRAVFSQSVEISNLEITGAGMEEAFLYLTQQSPEQPERSN